MRIRRSPYAKHLLALLSLAVCFWIAVPVSAQSTQDHDTTARELGSFDSFMDGHPEIAEQLRKNPSLVEDKDFVANHPDLQQYLQNHPGVREEIQENPNAFMHQEQRFDARETRKELTNFDQFLDSHPEIAEQLRKDPSLVNNKKFVNDHPDLKEFLQQHGGAAQDFRQNPNGFMQEEERFDRREDGMNRDRDGDRDLRRGQLASMDRFLDGHPEIAEQVQKDPSLLTNEKFVEQHPALQTYLQQHPQVREEISENPNNFMQREQRFDQREQRFGQREDGMDRDRDRSRGQLASMDRFLDSHPEIAEQVQKDPSLLTNKKFVEQHPALHAYLQQNPQVREEVSENPNNFMQREQRFDQREDGMDRDRSHGQLEGMDRFLDSHPEIAEQVKKDPSLLTNKNFVDQHPGLQGYLQQHPQVRNEIAENPNGMQPGQRFDRQENYGQSQGRFDSDARHGELTSFGQFLGGHESVAQQLAKNPSLANNEEYMANHPELKAYLQAHPGVQQQLKENPQAFMQSMQQQSKPAPKGTTMQRPQSKQY
jgi:phage-related protein